MRHVLTLACVLAGLGAAACDVDPKPGKVECPAKVAADSSAAPVQGTVTRVTVDGIPYEGTALTTEGIEVEGEAVHRNGLAIRHVFVGEVEATPETFNFKTWRAVLPFRALAGALAESGGDEVSLEVIARDACGQESLLDTVEVTVDRTPGIQVESLSLVLGDPDDPTAVLPADGSAATVVRVVANASAAGAFVDVAASAGALEGLASGRALLTGNGTDPAEATLLFRGSSPGPVLLTATAEGKLATALLDVVGPPELVPPEATLEEGERIVVSVVADGGLATCQATPRAGVSVTSGGEDLMGGPVDPTGGDPTRGTFAVEGVGPLEDTVTVTVSCFDAFGQFAKGSYTVEPAPADGFTE